jgi:hypothetical protein
MFRGPSTRTKNSKECSIALTLLELGGNLPSADKQVLCRAHRYRPFFPIRRADDACSLTSNSDAPDGDFSSSVYSRWRGRPGRRPPPLALFIEEGLGDRQQHPSPGSRVLIDGSCWDLLESGR